MAHKCAFSDVTANDVMIVSMLQLCVVIYRVNSSRTKLEDIISLAIGTKVSKNVGLNLRKVSKNVGLNLSKAL